MKRKAPPIECLVVAALLMPQNHVAMREVRPVWYLISPIEAGREILSFERRTIRGTFHSPDLPG